MWITPETFINLSSTDEGCGLGALRYRLNNGPWMNYTQPFTLPNEGQYVLEYMALDYLGNAEPFMHLALGLDASPPELVIKSPQEDHLYIAGRAVLTLHRTSTVDAIILGPTYFDIETRDSSGILTIELYIDNTLRYTSYNESLEWKWDATALFKHKHTITVRAEDTLGHVATKELTLWVLNI